MKKLLMPLCAAALLALVYVLPASSQISPASPRGGSASTAQFTKVTDGSETATVRDTGASDSLNVSIVDASGNQVTSFGVGGATTPTDNFANPTNAGNSAAFNFVWDGSTWHLQRGNALGALVQGTVATDSAIGATFPLVTGGRASNVAPTAVSADGDAVPVWHDRNGRQIVSAISPDPADILAGRQSFTSTTGAVTLITVPAGKIWVGTIGASVDCNTAAASTVSCKANATFTTSGAGVTPAGNQTWFVCQATSGANTATGTTGSQGTNFCSTPFTAACASGTCAINIATTQAGSASLVEAFANGNLQ